MATQPALHGGGPCDRPLLDHSTNLLSLVADVAQRVAERGPVDRTAWCDVERSLLCEPHGEQFELLACCIQLSRLQRREAVVPLRSKELGSGGSQRLQQGLILADVAGK